MTVRLPRPLRIILNNSEQRQFQVIVFFLVADSLLRDRLKRALARKNQLLEAKTNLERDKCKHHFFKLYLNLYENGS
jgi:hypothetical protein